MTATVAHARLQRIRAIKAAERALGLDESAHRQLVFGVAGRESLKDCSVGELNAVLDHLNKRSGYKRPEKGGGQRKQCRSDEARKVRALWLMLHRLGAVRNPEESALAAYARRQAGVDDLHWADRRMFALIEGLKAWAARLLPAALELRIGALARAGTIAPTSLTALQRACAPTRSPDTFDALHAAWDYLDGLEGIDRNGADHVAAAR